MRGCLGFRSCGGPITSSNKTEEVGNTIAEVQEENSADIETPGEDDNTAEHWQDNTTLDDISKIG